MIRLPATWLVIVVTALATTGCASLADGTDGVGAGSALEGSASSASKAKPPGKEVPGPAAPSTSPPDGAPSGTDPGASTASKFSCSPAGIATYADALAKETQKACTDDGVGVVNNTDYECIKKAIDKVGPPHPDESYKIVTTLLAPNQDYPMLECTYFVQMVTAGVCGTPISPNDRAWTEYPLATEFANKDADGYTWIDNDGTQSPQPGDIFIYSGTGGQDPGHIMIVAEVVDDGQFRIAEANELNPDGSQATGGETGAVTNVRIATLDDPQFGGWFRMNAK